MSQMTLLLICVTCTLIATSFLLYQIKKLWEGMVALKNNHAIIREDMSQLVAITQKLLEFSKLDGEAIMQLRDRVARLERDHCEGI